MSSMLLFESYCSRLSCGGFLVLFCPGLVVGFLGGVVVGFLGGVVVGDCGWNVGDCRCSWNPNLSVVRKINKNITH